MLKVSDINKSIFNSPFLTFLPDACDVCGAELLITEPLRQMRCSNRKCPAIVSYRLYGLLTALGIHSMTLEDCSSFLIKFKSDNPYSILLYRPTTDGLIHDNYTMQQSEDLYKALNKARGMLLWEFVKIGTYDELEESAKLILEDYTDLTSFYTDLADKGILFIQDRLLKDADIPMEGVLVKAVRLYETFVFYKDELETGIKGVVILNPEHKYSVLFANNSSAYKSNATFLKQLNNKLKGSAYVYELKRFSSAVDFIYWEANEANIENSCVLYAREHYADIPVVNEQELLQAIKG